MSNDLYIHTWSNGDISIYCFECGGNTSLNFSSGTHQNYRNYCRIWETYGLEDYTGKLKFVGCMICKRGAQVILVRKRIYLVEFKKKVKYIQSSDEYLGGTIRTLPWIFYDRQEV